MMDQLPDPMTPPDCDLRGLPFMPLEVSRLLESDLWMLSTGDELKAALALWCRSWSQVPAASLPNDDRLLSRLSGADRKWPKLRAMAMRGWVLCADNRWYHPLISSRALDAHAKRIAQSVRAKSRWNNETRDATASPRQSHGSATAMQGTVEVRDKGKGEEQLLPGATSQAPGSCSSATQKPTPGIDSPGPRASRGDRGSRLPADWHPSEADEEFARQLGIDPAREADSFRDYWHGKPGAAGRKSDWTATWRNWIRRSSERKSNGSGSRPTDRRPDRNGFVELILQRRPAGGDSADFG